MAFIGSVQSGQAYAPGWFLAHEECTRKTKEIPQTMATTAANGTKYVKMGTPFPSNDANCIGIIYEDIDVTVGNMPGSVVTKGEVIEDRLPVELNANAKTALGALGFTFVTEAEVTRPY